MTVSTSKDYIIAVQAPAYSIDDDSFATESAFAVHLKELRISLGERFRQVILIAPQLTDHEYRACMHQLSVVSCKVDGVKYLPAHRTTTSAMRFWSSECPRIWRTLARALPSAAVVHSGLADDLHRPLMAVVNMAAWLRRRPIVFIVDIDFRNDTRRYYALRMWSLKRYLAHRLVYDPLKWLQVWLAPRLFQLVLLKSASMVRDFGRGRSHVKNFYDTVHSPKDLLPLPAREEHLSRLAESSGPLRLVYFGRFVPYKGLTHAVEAVRLARAEGHDVELLLVGDGECLPALREQVDRDGLHGSVIFVPPVRYGQALFDVIGQAHLTIATPLVEDTPRAAFDSMARGLPIVAFDIQYFRDLAYESGAVELAAWPDPRSLADVIGQLHRDRARLAQMARRAIGFAEENTQAIWLERRASWVRGLAP